jgi:hypothetical protein
MLISVKHSRSPWPTPSRTCVFLRITAMVALLGDLNKGSERSVNCRKGNARAATQLMTGYSGVMSCALHRPGQIAMIRGKHICEHIHCPCARTGNAFVDDCRSHHLHRDESASLKGTCRLPHPSTFGASTRQPLEKLCFFREGGPRPNCIEQRVGHTRPRQSSSEVLPSVCIAVTYSDIIEAFCLCTRKE